AAEDTARHPRPHAAGAQVAHRPGHAADGTQGLCRPGGRKDLHMGSRVVPTDRGTPTALPGPDGTVAVVLCAGNIPDNAGAGRAAIRPGAAARRSRAPLGGPQRARVDVALAR